MKVRILIQIHPRFISWKATQLRSAKSGLPDVLQSRCQAAGQSIMSQEYNSIETSFDYLRLIGPWKWANSSNLDWKWINHSCRWVSRTGDESVQGKRPNLAGQHPMGATSANFGSLLTPRWVILNHWVNDIYIYNIGINWSKYWISQNPSFNIECIHHSMTQYWTTASPVQGIGTLTWEQMGLEKKRWRGDGIISKYIRIIAMNSPF